MPDDLWKWVPLLSLFGNALLVWLLWSMRQAFITRADFSTHTAAEEQWRQRHDAADGEWRAAQEAQALKLGARIDLTAQQIASLPRVEDLTKLRTELAEVKGEARTSTEMLKSVSASVRRIEDYLLREAKEAR